MYKFLEKVGVLYDKDVIHPHWLELGAENYRKVLKKVLKTDLADESLMYLGGGTLPSSELLGVRDKEAYFSGLHRHMILRLYLELGFLSVDECEADTVKLVSNTALNLQAKFEMICPGNSKTSITDGKLRQLFRVDEFMHSLSSIINVTGEYMMTVFQGCSHLREYNAQTQFVLRLKRDWMHKFVKIRPENYTPINKNGFRKRIDVVADLYNPDDPDKIGLKAINELKFSKKPITSDEGSQLLEEAWEQALTAYRMIHGRIRPTYKVLLIALVFHWTGNMMDTRMRYREFDGNEGGERDQYVIDTVNNVRQHARGETITGNRRCSRLTPCQKGADSSAA